MLLEENIRNYDKGNQDIFQLEMKMRCHISLPRHDVDCPIPGHKIRFSPAEGNLKVVQRRLPSAYNFLLPKDYITVLLRICFLRQFSPCMLKGGEPEVSKLHAVP